MTEIEGIFAASLLDRTLVAAVPASRASTDSTSRWMEGGVLLPGIKIKENEHFDVALRRFKKQVEKAGVMFELRRREYYEKPSIRKKKKTIAARKRALKKHRQVGV